MEQKNQTLLNGLPDLRPFLKKAKVKSPTDVIWKQYPEISRTTIYRCIIGDGKHSKIFDIRKQALKMIKSNNVKIESELNEII